MVTINRFSIRSYSRQSRSHVHHYHQLVLPLNGSIELKIGNYHGLVSPGECAMIKAGQRHDFQAREQARFIVLDCDVLPEHILLCSEQKLTIDSALLSYVQFIENQLHQNVSAAIEQAMFELFMSLLTQQPLSHKVDKRIEKIISQINQDLSQPFNNEALAQQAFLSATQFKKRFKASTGVSPQQYITRLRMEKAKALLSHTDTPISIIAGCVGYQNPSAFSRVFKKHFGDVPTAFQR